MPHSTGLSTWLILLLVIIIWPVFFVALWSGIVLFIARIGGWRRLAKHYGAIGQPAGGRTMRNVTGTVGRSRYRRLLNVTTAQDGMFVEVRWIFRMGHPTLFIPWGDIRKARRMRLFYKDYVVFDVGDPRIAGMRLPSEVFDATPVFID